MLAAEGDLSGEIQHRDRIDGAAADHHDPPRLLGDVEPGVVGTNCHGERLLERRHLDETDPHVGQCGPRG